MTISPIASILAETQKLIFTPCGFELTNPIAEKESAAYSAYTFKLNHLKILFRTAKTTPSKIGQFVTLWKRIDKGPIQPYDLSDDFDFMIINTRTENHFGQFVFPKSVLSEQGILTKDLREGKRAIRVYPPWDKPNSKQALKTQKWQSYYFLDIPFDQPLNLNRAKLLYTPESRN